MEIKFGKVKFKCDFIVKRVTTFAAIIDKLVGMANHFTMSSLKVGVLGGGQLGRMLMEAANRLNIQMNVLDAENAPAKQISAHEGHIIGSFIDQASVQKLAKACDVLTAEIEHVDTYALEEVASEVKVEPSWKTIRIIQNKFHQKEHLSKFKIPMGTL